MEGGFWPICVFYIIFRILAIGRPPIFDTFGDSFWHLRARPHFGRPKMRKMMVKTHIANWEVCNFQKVEKKLKTEYSENDGKKVAKMFPYTFSFLSTPPNRICTFTQNVP